MRFFFLKDIWSRCTRYLVELINLYLELNVYDQKESVLLFRGNGAWKTKTLV